MHPPSPRPSGNNHADVGAPPLMKYLAATSYTSRGPSITPCACWGKIAPPIRPIPATPPVRKNDVVGIAGYLAAPTHKVAANDNAAPPPKKEPVQGAGVGPGPQPDA